MSGAIRDKPVAQMLFYFCGCREIRFRELNTDSRLPVTLSTLRRNPDYFPVNRDFLRLIHECQQKNTSSPNSYFLFVGTKRQASSLIAQEAKRSNSYYVNHRWLGGMLTNWSTMKERIEKLKDLEKQESEGTFDLLTKKEGALRRKELIKLRKYLDGIKSMTSLPDVVIIIDQRREITAIAECRKLGIPVVSILDTNCDPDLVDIPIPGNDDAVRSIKLILTLLTDSIIKGQMK